MASYTYFPKSNGENKFLKANWVLKVHVSSQSHMLGVCWVQLYGVNSF